MVQKLHASSPSPPDLHAFAHDVIARYVSLREQASPDPCARQHICCAALEVEIVLGAQDSHDKALSNRGGMPPPQ